MRIPTPVLAERRRIVVAGLVQGVGFRPFVYRLARDCGLTGWVRNTGAGVEMELEGDPAELERFESRLAGEAPPLARIERVEMTTVTAAGGDVLEILPSAPSTGAPLPVSPDTAVCAACLSEIDDPTARRFRYPFTNCTECGPRFTIIEALPYDRERTAMAAFPLCDACRMEYGDPVDRRFHAEPIACPACGPSLEYVGPLSGAAPGDALERSIATILTGGIVAVKGLGGFQLACDAGDQDAVARLRERKHRDAKPFAVMIQHVEAARALCEVSDAEAELLAGPAAPIVLLRRRVRHGGLAEGVAPGLDTLGVMLPCTPLHHLLARGVGRPLVLTSGNRSDEPIATDNREALDRLSGIADAFLLHDRAIASRYDDSVVRFDGAGPIVLRRARGYAPAAITLAEPAPAPILALGAQLKNTVCLVGGRSAFVSQHIGDLDDALTLAHQRETISLYRRLFSIDPQVLAHDLHPDHAGTRFARELEDLPRIAVQHHHAHVASVMAEHGRTEPVIGIAFDGTGYGSDGAVWGGELMVADCRSFRRLVHLRYLPLPGGDAAARRPWQMAIAALAAAFPQERDAEASSAGEADLLATELLPRIPSSERRMVLRMARRGIHAPPTSSAGRLFDAVAALVGVRDVNAYEGQAAMELEAGVDPEERGGYALPLVEGGRANGVGSSEMIARVTSTDWVPAYAGMTEGGAGMTEGGPGMTEGGAGMTEGGAAVWDTTELIRAVVADVRRGTPAGVVSARFHAALAAAIVEGCRWARGREGIETVALSGGCFQNRVLLDSTRARLEADGFEVLTNRRVPPNDGGVSLGQAAVALATYAG